MALQQKAKCIMLHTTVKLKLMLRGAGVGQTTLIAGVL